MPKHETFICANKSCTYISRQPLSHVAQELDEYKLCRDCYKKGLRLKQGVLVLPETEVLSGKK